MMADSAMAAAVLSGASSSSTTPSAPPNQEPLLVPSKTHVRLAALHILDAWTGRVRAHPREGASWIRRCWLVHLSLHYPARIAIWLLIVLSLFERPGWCLRRNLPIDFNTTLYPTFGLPMLTDPIDLSLEGPLLLILLVDVACQMAAQGVHGTFSSPLHRHDRIKQLLYASLVLLALVEAAVTSVAAQSWYKVRLAPFLRLGLLILRSPPLLQQLDLLARTTPQVGGILLVLLAFVAAFSWAAALCFEGTPGFEGFGEAMWSLSVALTTANFPDVMMEQYSGSRAVVLFFAPFMILNLFLMNLVLAVVVKAHADSRAHAVDEAFATRERALRAAFAALACGRPTLTRETLLAVFTELNYYRGLSRINEERAQLLFAALDRSGSSEVDEGEFLSLCDLLKIRFERIPQRLWLDVALPRFAASGCWQRVSSLVKSRRFDHGVDLLLVLAGILLVIEERQIMAGRPEDFDDRPDSLWNILELVFSALFLVEMLIKLAALGWKEYTRSYKNLFDAIVSVATFSVVIVVYIPNSYNDARYIRVVLLLRLLRLLRLLKNVPQVRFVSSTFLAVLPDARRLLQMIFVLLYGFSALGVMLFGGTINLDPTQPELKRLEKTAYAADDYFANNFNDLASGLVTCFELLLINNWIVLCDAFVAVTTSVWSRAFFVTFFVLGPLVCLNIAVAFCIEAFLEYTQMVESGRAGDEGEGEDGGEGDLDATSAAAGGGTPGTVVQSMLATILDASEVTGTATGLSGQYRATVASRATLDMHRGADLRGRLLADTLLPTATRQPSSGASHAPGGGAPPPEGDQAAPHAVEQHGRWRWSTGSEPGGGS